MFIISCVNCKSEIKIKEGDNPSKKILVDVENISVGLKCEKCGNDIVLVIQQ